MFYEQPRSQMRIFDLADRATVVAAKNVSLSCVGSAARRAAAEQERAAATEEAVAPCVSIPACAVCAVAVGLRVPWAAGG